MYGFPCDLVHYRLYNSFCRYANKSYKSYLQRFDLISTHSQPITTSYTFFDKASAFDVFWERMLCVSVLNHTLICISLTKIYSGNKTQGMVRARSISLFLFFKSPHSIDSRNPPLPSTLMETQKPRTTGMAGLIPESDGWSTPNVDINRDFINWVGWDVSR